MKPPESATTLQKESRNTTSYILIFFIIACCYCNTLEADWHFDDLPNILWNKALHLPDLSPSSLYQTFFAYPLQQGNFFRPISNLSFALNWFVGQNNVIGYHLVNRLIHFLTTVFLYKTILLLFTIPRLQDLYRGKEQFIALLAATLWAVNPIQTQAITYIVQRMASLAALFYIVGIFLYLKGRLSNSKGSRYLIYLLGSFIVYLLALGSKENTIMFPCSLLLIEIIFFQSSFSLNKKHLLFLITTLALVTVAGLILTNCKPFSFLDTYQSRSYNILERVLTEARIIIYYLSQILYPIPTRLSLTHDIHLSTSFFKPLSTLPSILFLTTLTFWAILKHKKYPLIAFAILFFLLNHLVESTIIPLELFFEHRNYLPSLFLFLPLATGAQLIVDFYKPKPIMRFCIISFLILLITSLSTGTWIRNQVWITEESLWKDSLLKAPNTAKSYINLAHTYLNQGKLGIAFELNREALEKFSPTPWKNTLRSYHNMGNIMQELQQYNNAIYLYDKALQSDPKNKDVLYNKFLAQQKNNYEAEAFTTITNLVNAHPDNILFHNALGKIYLKKSQLQLALNIFHQTARNISSANKQKGEIILNMGIVFSRMKNYDKADLYFRYGKILGVKMILIDFCSLENSIRNSNLAAAEFYLHSLLTHLTWPQLQQNLQEIHSDNFSVALDSTLLSDFINNRVTDITRLPINNQ